MPLHRWDEITDLCQRIVEVFEPEKIVLFGSYAYGRPTAWSDVDLLVLMPYHGSARQMAAEILQRIQPSFGIDLLVRAPDEVAARLAIDDEFIHEVMTRGRVLYEADHARVG